MVRVTYKVFAYLFQLVICTYYQDGREVIYRKMFLRVNNGNMLDDLINTLEH